MDVIHGVDRRRKFQNTVATIGVFDGIHVGHQKILREVVKSAKKSKSRSVVVTFAPHPSGIVSGKPVPILLSLSEKISLLRELGIETCLIINFDKKFSNLSPQDFVRQILVDYLKVRVVIIGYNYVFGKDKKGNSELLSEMGAKFGFSLKPVESVKIRGEVVSSTRIRELIRDADFVKVNSFLGRQYGITGKVEKGDARGRIIGFPTANLNISCGLLPLSGVYAGFTVVGGVQYKAALSIGCKPTLSPESKVQSQKPEVHSPESMSQSEAAGVVVSPPQFENASLEERKSYRNALVAEVHILGFNRNIYGEELTFNFHRKVRDEIAFPNLNELKKQIEKDIEKIRKIH